MHVTNDNKSGGLSVALFPMNRNIYYYGYLTVSGIQLDGREAGLDLIIGDFGEM